MPTSQPATTALQKLIASLGDRAELLDHLPFENVTFQAQGEIPLALPKAILFGTLKRKGPISQTPQVWKAINRANPQPKNKNRASAATASKDNFRLDAAASPPPNTSLEDLRRVLEQDAPLLDYLPVDSTYMTADNEALGGHLRDRIALGTMSDVDGNKKRVYAYKSTAYCTDSLPEVHYLGFYRAGVEFKPVKDLEATKLARLLQCFFVIKNAAIPPGSILSSRFVNSVRAVCQSFKRTADGPGNASATFPALADSRKKYQRRRNFIEIQEESSAQRIDLTGFKSANVPSRQDFELRNLAEQKKTEADTAKKEVVDQRTKYAQALRELEHDRIAKRQVQDNLQNKLKNEQARVPHDQLLHAAKAIVNLHLQNKRRKMAGDEDSGGQVGN
ncbi:hypothetical protein EK21DRAFT_117776 [Setomelanomma holmii]|uniref:Uncharacterized protein n=1 Tax=Setomelanomma holmii TaxID=210430 RepID=A0A9P4GXF0_9PLEO|nr:hypothetical protein EK21DRAFT_117776 [Setomelanomma holmii]